MKTEKSINFTSILVCAHQFTIAMVNWVIMVTVGFEPTKALPADLKSTPFNRSGTSPTMYIVGDLIIIIMVGFEPTKASSQCT